MSEKNTDSSTLAARTYAIGQRLRPDGRGVFVEAGANDGIRQSNTLALERIGWTGLLIEPSPKSFAALLRNRPRSTCIQAALVESNRVTELEGTFASDSLMATAHEALMERDRAGLAAFSIERLRRGLGLKARPALTTVPARTLNEVLTSFGVTDIDLLSLDVEGFEFKVLTGLTDFRPRIVIIETRSFDAFLMSELMLSKGYLLAANLSNFNVIDHPQWTSDHQDFCWVQSADSAALAAVLDSA